METRTARSGSGEGGPPEGARQGNGALPGQERLERLVGGPARLRVVVLLACVLALDSADGATIGAIAGELQAHLHISNLEIGLLATSSAVVGALATVPVGILTDRTRRVTLLAGSIVLWSAAMFGSAASGSYGVLLATRLALGAVTATAGPTLASLTGDFFPAGERGRIYGFILSGELIGAGIGFVVSGDIAGALDWRWSFVFLAVPGLALAAAIWRLLPEPARGGQSQLRAGQRHIPSVEEVAEHGGEPDDALEDAAELAEARDDVAQEAVVEEQVPPIEDQVLDRDPVSMPLWGAVRYVLSIRTNVVLIVASALGYFFFTGLRTFAVVYLRERYGLGQAAASSLLAVIGLGALAGVLLSGRIADGLIRRGRLDGRIVVPSAAYIGAAAAFVPGFAVTIMPLAIALSVVGAGGLAAANPPLDAARLDVIHPHLWGRAEGVRTLLRLVAVALGPLLFGFVADRFGAHASFGNVGAGSVHHVTGNGQGLEYTFLIMLVPLLFSGLILRRAMRSYPRDVATAVASLEATTGRGAERETAGSSV